MTENKQFTIDNPNDWDFSITDNVTGKVYNCASNILMKELCVVVNTIVEENDHLKQQAKYSEIRTALISGWLHDEGNLTLKKYEEILDYCYQQYKKEVLND